MSKKNKLTIENAMNSLITKLKQADESFTALSWDFLGMRNFIQRVTHEKINHPAWKQVIETSPEAQTIIEFVRQNELQTAA